MIIIQPKTSFLGVVFDVDHDFEGPRAPKAYLDTVNTNLSHQVRRPFILSNANVRKFPSIRPPLVGIKLGSQQLMTLSLAFRGAVGSHTWPIHLPLEPFHETPLCLEVRGGPASTNW